MTQALVITKHKLGCDLLPGNSYIIRNSRNALYEVVTSKITLIKQVRGLDDRHTGVMQKRTRHYVARVENLKTGKVRYNWISPVVLKQVYELI